MLQGSGQCNSISVQLHRQVFLSRFSRWGDTPDRGPHPPSIPLTPPSQGQTSVTTKPMQEGTATFLCVSSTWGTPQGLGCRGSGHPGEGEGEGRADTPSGQQEALPAGVQRLGCMEAKDQNLVGGKKI